MQIIQKYTKKIKSNYSYEMDENLSTPIKILKCNKAESNNSGNGVVFKSF